METKTNLDEKTIETLQELIQINLDSQDGFQQVAEKTDDTRVAQLFRSLGQERGAQAEELKSLVMVNSETPEDSGSFAAAAHRVWIDLRAALGGDAKVMLIEAEKGEDAIKEKYEEALKDEPGTAVSDVLHRQYAAVKAGHDKVRDLRDAYKAKD